MFIQQGKEPFFLSNKEKSLFFNPRWLNVGLKIALAFMGRKDLLIAFRTTLWNFFSKSKGAPPIACLPAPLSLPQPCSRVFLRRSGAFLTGFDMVLGGGGGSRAACLPSAAVEGFLRLPLPFPKESVAAKCTEMWSTDTKAENHGLAYCPQNN